MHARHAIVLASALSLLNGCATVLNPSTDTVSVASNPPGAQVYVDGHPVGQTPTAVTLDSTKSHRIHVTKPGYADGGCILETTIGGGWVILDILLGLVPLIVDAATGDWKSLETNRCYVTFGPAQTSPAYPPPPPGLPPGAPPR